MRCYFNNGFSYRSVGSDYVPEADEVVFSEFEEVTEAMLAEAFSQYMALKQRDGLLQEIATLEAQQTPRRIREAALHEDGKVWLETLNTRINNLRKKL